MVKQLSKNGQKWSKNGQKWSKNGQKMVKKVWIFDHVVYDYPQRQLQYLKINVDQVFTYLSKYQDFRLLPKNTFETIENMKTTFMDKTVLKPAEVTEVMTLGMDLLANTKKMCQSMFVDFDLKHIHMGLSIRWHS